MDKKQWNKPLSVSKEEFKLLMEELDRICDNESQYSDEEFAQQLNDLYDRCPMDTDFNHIKSNLIVKRRVNQYCKNNNIKHQDYKGVLPYRLFIIEATDSDIPIEERIQKMKDKIKESPIADLSLPVHEPYIPLQITPPPMSIIDAFEKKTNANIIKSVDEDQGNIIKNIIKLHIPSGKIDCDITYSVGNFYKKTGIEQPTHKFDKFPQTEDSIKIEDKILLDDESIDSLMFDPPFVIGGVKNVKDYDDGSCIIGKRFAQYSSIEELMESYSTWIKESFRVLKKNGIFIVKCQDTVSGGKQFLTHNFVNNESVRCGFYPKDLFILIAKNRLIGPKHHNQQHARKFHSYFLVFKKEKFKNIYL
jgi:hypothetical protein